MILPVQITYILDCVWFSELAETTLILCEYCVTLTPCVIFFKKNFSISTIGTNLNWMHVCIISDPETVPKEKELAEKPAKEISSAKTVM